ncbi:Carboxylesterase type B [Macrophomina phaseolina MS6]|uniref:Carboxylic ester hydrolase n=1 Tax=Macrophomina phaseolina (strain MS6) TaxID=1126212 RepID=K2QK50_MACPH|nr:Carboxylesterase type B [Macrophomina phaseolina MS6]
MLSLSGQNGASEGIVFVSINYRLGALGWMSGTDFEHAGGLPNAGLYDQRMALEWVQENIHYFGGDKNRVTVVGESGGSGSITHHIAAYGAAPVPFRQAILQSPAWFPNLPRSAQDLSFQQFLHLANASSLEHARNLSTDALMTANTHRRRRSELSRASSHSSPRITDTQHIQASSSLHHSTTPHPSSPTTSLPSTTPPSRSSLTSSTHPSTTAPNPTTTSSPAPPSSPATPSSTAPCTPCQPHSPTAATPTSSPSRGSTAKTSGTRSTGQACRRAWALR